MGHLTEGFTGRLDGGVRPAVVNGDSVETSSVHDKLKHGEANLGHKMEPLEVGVLMGALYRVGQQARRSGDQCRCR
jgi:hypothetical protein